MERAMGIEPTSEAWEASILPLYDARSLFLIVLRNLFSVKRLRPATNQPLRDHLSLGQRNHVCAPDRVAVNPRKRRVGPGLAGRDRYGHGQRPRDVSSGFAHQLHSPVYAKLGEQR